MLNDIKVKKKLKSFDKLVLEVGYPSNLAYKLSNMHGRTSTIFKEKVNVLVFEEVYKNYKELMELDSPNVKLYFFILNEFPLTVGYDDEVIKEKLELLKNTHSIELKESEFREYLNYVYIVESKKVRLSNKNVPPKDYINNKNSCLSVEQNSKSKTHKRVYCPTDYHTIESICKDYGLNDLDKKYIKGIIESKLHNINFKSKRIIEHLKVFS